MLLQACQQQEPNPSKELSGTSQKDDKKYFKELSKTTNPYWLENAEEVFNRLDWKRLVNPRSKEGLKESFRKRYAEVDIDAICKLWKERDVCTNEAERRALTQKLVTLGLWVPNETHEEAEATENEIPKEVYRFGEATNANVEEFSKFCNRFGYLRDDQLGNLTYAKSYYLKGPLAELEDGLIRFSLSSLAKNGFQIISVPDIIYPHIIESCGMRTRGERDQVFWLQSEGSEENACLSGTAEMSIGGSLQNKIFNEEDLPLKFTSVSRCFRAETSSLQEERGLYRVHEFTKVEMFGVTANETGSESDNLHQEFRRIEESNFASLNIHFKTLEMPPSELGASAYRKFDIEAWMPGRKMFGEISSCSNCTDFQSRRFNIRYKPKNARNGEDLKYTHTVNGTACAVPRLLITLVENFQKPDGNVELPLVLKPFMPRSWKDAMSNFPNHKSLFLRTKTQQDKYYPPLQLRMGDTSTVKCCVPLCKATSENSRTVSFYKFPEDENFKAEWIQVLKDMEMFGTIVKDKKSEDVSGWHICSRHFTSEDFEKLPVIKTEQLRKSTRSSQESLVKRYLCYDAVPSVFMKQTKKVGGWNKKVIIMKRKTGLPRTSTSSSAGSPNAKKMKVKKDDEQPISRLELSPNKLLVTSSAPVVLNVKGTPTQNTSEISAKMENIVNKMELTLNPKPSPSTSYRKAIPGVPDHDTSQSNRNMEEAVMSWLSLPQNIHAPYKPEPVRMRKTMPSPKVSNKQPERRSLRATVTTQPRRSIHTPPTTSLASVAQRLIVSKTTPVVSKNVQKGQKNSTTSITVTPTSQPKHKPPKVTVTNATKKPSKQNIQNAEPERKQPGTVHSMLSDAITKVFATPSSSKTGRVKARQCPIPIPKLTYTPQQISTLDGLLDDNLSLNVVKTQNNNPGKSSNNKLRQTKEKRKGIKMNDCDPSSSDSDESDNVEYVNGQVPWEAEDDASETYDNDDMEDEVPDENIDYDSYSNGIRLPTHSVLEMGASNDDDEGSIHQDPLAILKYEVIEEHDDDVNDPANEYSTPLLNGFAFGMTEEDCTTILSAPAASSAVTAVPESANSSDDLVDAIEVKVEPTRIEYLSDDDNADSCGLVPETQIDGNNPGYSCAVETVFTEGTTPEVKVKTEPMELLTS
ncbi:Serine--tRNA ligase, chloroplastic/mitochondrial [Orchesella cincta]|uniref:serine--tRNA ligase n=1 Tax=Orchesella cincta TaxID=48709 RepID=A0A1D2MNI0_ORCCI|nr:Serine--tRNA ligase, chloroplastic/mitochondrial [Orchesella cincta]